MPTSGTIIVTGLTREGRGEEFPVGTGETLGGLGLAGETVGVADLAAQYRVYQSLVVAGRTVGSAGGVKGLGWTGGAEVGRASAGGTAAVA